MFIQGAMSPERNHYITSCVSLGCFATKNAGTTRHHVTTNNDVTTKHHVYPKHAVTAKQTRPNTMRLTQIVPLENIMS